MDADVEMNGKHMKATHAWSEWNLAYVIYVWLDGIRVPRLHISGHPQFDAVLSGLAASDTLSAVTTPRSI